MPKNYCELLVLVNVDHIDQRTERLAVQLPHIGALRHGTKFRKRRSVLFARSQLLLHFCYGCADPIFSTVVVCFNPEISIPVNNLFFQLLP